MKIFRGLKKRKGRVSNSTLKKYMKERPEFSEKYIKMLADYFEVSPQ